MIQTMTLYSVRDWLKTLGIGENFYVGRLEDNKEKSLGVYKRDEKTADRICVGGYENNGYETLKVSILLHWNKSARETEDAGIQLFNELRKYRGGGFYIGSNFVNGVRLATTCAVDVGADNKKIFERVIWLDIIYK